MENICHKLASQELRMPTVQTEPAFPASFAARLGHMTYTTPMRCIHPKFWIGDWFHKDFREYILERLMTVAAAMASVTAAMSTAVNCASCTAIQCLAVAAEASSLDQFCSLIPCIVPGDINFQPYSSVLSEIPFLLKSTKMYVAFACNKEPCLK